MFNAKSIAPVVLSLIGVVGMVHVNRADASARPVKAPSAFASLTAPEFAAVHHPTAAAKATAAKPARKAKSWACGAPRKLANDAIQTVRECEWR